MDFNDIQAALNPHVIERFKEAIATGRWADGRAVSPGQRETCLQAVIAWEAKHLPADQRVGFMPAKSACASDANPASELDATPSPVNIDRLK